MPVIERFPVLSRVTRGNIPCEKKRVSTRDFRKIEFSSFEDGVFQHCMGVFDGICMDSGYVLIEFEGFRAQNRFTGPPLFSRDSGDFTFFQLSRPLASRLGPYFVVGDAK